MPADTEKIQLNNRDDSRRQGLVDSDDPYVW